MTERQFVETIQTPAGACDLDARLGDAFFFGWWERSGTVWPSLTNAAMARGIRWLDEVDEFPAGR